MHRVGSLFNHCNSNNVLGHQADDNDYKRRALSTDSSGYNFESSSFGPQAGRRLSRSTSIVANNSVEDYVKKTKKTATYLKLLLHSKKCGGQCKMPNCVYTSRILKHIINCTALEQNCGIPGCHTTKKLLKHYDDCGGKKVEICKDGCHSQRKSFTAVSELPNSPHSLYQPQKDTEQSSFCLLCSLVSSDIAADTPTSYTDGDNSTDETDSLVIFDEIMDYSKVPFQKSDDVGDYNSYYNNNTIYYDNNNNNRYRCYSADAVASNTSSSLKNIFPSSTTYDNDMEVDDATPSSSYSTDSSTSYPEHIISKSLDTSNYITITGSPSSLRRKIRSKSLTVL